MDSRKNAFVYAPIPTSVSFQSPRLTLLFTKKLPSATKPNHAANTFQKFHRSISRRSSFCLMQPLPEKIKINDTIVNPCAIKEDCQDCSEESNGNSSTETDYCVLIEYCTGCRWLLRAGWMAQELLVTFEKDLKQVTIKPNHSGGVFDVWLNDRMIWTRKEMKRFPELKEIKQIIRDNIDPEKSLGHSDRQNNIPSN